MNTLNYSGNLSIFAKNINDSFKEKYSLNLNEFPETTLVNFTNLSDTTISFATYIVEEGNAFKCTFLIGVNGNKTYVGEYTVDIIHTESLLPTIIDFATVVTSEVSEEMLFDFSHELACATKKAALKFDEVKEIDSQTLLDGRVTISQTTSNLVFLDQDFVVQEKIDELKVN